MRPGQQWRDARTVITVTLQRDEIRVGGHTVAVHHGKGLLLPGDRS